jgi:thiol-disulfide isomerase/thioredoxin
VKRRVHRFFVILAMAGVVLVALAIVGNTFVRGMAVGILGFTTLVAGGFAFTVRRRAKAGGRPRLKPPPVPTTRWDYAMRARDVEGAPVAFSEFAGKVLVLNLWATWCVPCIAEMPSLARLREGTSDLGVCFACVTREDVGKVRPFVEKQKVSLPFYMLEGELPDCFESRAIPATFILDRTGRIALRHVGAAAWDDDTVMTFVRGLAAAPSDPAHQATVDR